MLVVGPAVNSVCLYVRIPYGYVLVNFHSVCPYRHKPLESMAIPTVKDL